MLLCLSSGNRPRYRDDVLTGMALPFGAVVRLRYRPKYVGVWGVVTDPSAPLHQPAGPDAVTLAEPD